MLPFFDRNETILRQKSVHSCFSVISAFSENAAYCCFLYCGFMLVCWGLGFFFGGVVVLGGGVCCFWLGFLEGHHILNDFLS